MTTRRAPLPLLPDGLSYDDLLPLLQLTLSSGISAFVRDNFGFGDFVFRMPDGDEVARATNVFELMQRFTEIPDDALQYHAEGHGKKKVPDVVKRFIDAEEE